MAVTPPLRGPDEAAHFVRIYGISRGEVTASTADANGHKGIFLPERVYRDLLHFDLARETLMTKGRVDYRQVFAEHLRQRAERRASTGDEAQVFTLYSGSEGYAPIAYLPYITAALFARAGGLQFLETLYLMRLFGFVAMTAIVAYAIAMVPRLQWAFLLMAMLPEALYSRAVISADGAALACAMLITALCLRAAAGLAGSTPWQRSLWMTLCVLSKPPQIAFVLLEAMTQTPGALRRGWKSLALVILPALALTLAWTLASSADVAGWRMFEHRGIPPEQFDPVWKLKFLLEHPLHFISAVWVSLHDLSALWVQMIGLMGWMDTELRWWLYPALSALFLAVCLVRLDLDVRTRAWVALVAAAAVIGYWLALYVIFFLIWTEIAMDHVDGVQGRYLIVILPLAATIIATIVPRSLPETLRAWLATLGALLSGLATIDAVLRVDWLR